ncbi:SH3-containing GRB2-like protein 3-interacting protein 1 isoform X10 [Oncorhynchus mykiss]|uniref:SH3-containing GRB2-like protein 3-interacting protein 1 isoform X10 n=1 Tax=Oncorhynchus mykiss TaxID=8022 RepID=UPI0018778E62|nr:SH3-containing GRB2-like protein 3-interacting protein 1 isoform X10 [Oncorhynchus mykiss]
MAEELCTGWFRIVAGSLEIEECKSAIMMEGLKKRTRKAFGIRKKEKGDKDNDSTGSPDREGGDSQEIESSQKKANGAAVNGFSGEIDWDRYNTPTVDDEGYSLRPDEEEGPGSAGSKPPKEHFFSSSESEGEEDHRKKFKIKIKPLPAESANCLAPSVDELKASIGNIALSPSPLRSSPRRSPGLMTKDSGEEIQVARPRRPAPIEVPTLAAPALQVPRSKRAPAVPVPEKKAAPVPEDTAALFGPPLETAFGEQKTEVGISEPVVCGVWGAPLPESESLSPDFSFTRAFPTGTPPPLPPKNVPTSPPLTGSPSADAAGLSIKAEGSGRKTSVPNLDNIFGPAEPPAFGEESADKWICFSEEESAASEKPPPPTSPPPPEDPPAPPVPTSPLPLDDPVPAPSLSPLPTSPPPQEKPVSPLPTSPPPTDEPVPPLPTVPPTPKDPTPPPSPLPPKDPTPPPTPTPTVVPTLDLTSSIAPAPLVTSPTSVAPVPSAVPSSPKASTPVSPTCPPAPMEAPSRTIPRPLVLAAEEQMSPEAAALPVPPAPPKEDLSETTITLSPKDAGQVSRVAPPPPPPPTYRAVVSSPGPTTGGTGSGASSPARPATPSAPSAVVSSPTPPPPPPRPSSRPKLPPGKPSMGDVSRPFSPPVSHSSSPPPVAPLARAESTSSISSNNSLSAATTPTVGKDLTVSVSENDQPSLVWFDRGKFYLTFEGCSRGPSPLTMGAQDTLPVAAAFTETVNAFFKGADPNNDTVTTPNPDCKNFWVNMPNLMTHLKRVAEQKPQATYYNVDMLKYQVSAQGLVSTPLNLAASWRCVPTSTDLRIDYKYNGSAMTTPVALNNVQFLIHVDGGVTKLQAVLPPAAWNAEQQRILWKIPDISQKSENGGVGSLLARFQLSEGPSKPSSLAVQFTSEGSTLSGCDIELAGPGYRFSLVKKRFAAGKYLADN